ncbi:MAG: hypothetical protein WB995_05730, partial [Candidatus Acidiferrales bacterium]
LHHRPEISRATQMQLLGRALLDRCFTWLLPSAPPDNSDGGSNGGGNGAANGGTGSGVDSGSSLAGRHA